MVGPMNDVKLFPLFDLGLKRNRSLIYDSVYGCEK